MKKRLKIKQLVSLGLIFLMSINSFAAIVSDNDGSAFITKAEFEAMKSSFNKQIDDYNKSIDGKIDGAIAAYLSGIRLSTQDILTVKTPATEVYCMKYASDYDPKDMKYTYVTPYVDFTAVNWQSSSSNFGVYGWYIKMKPKAKKETGTRLYIQNVIDKDSSFDGCAEWFGYGTEVSETQAWSSTQVQYSIPGAGTHCARKNAFGMNHYDPIKNTKLGDNNWTIGTIIYVTNNNEQTNWSWGSQTLEYTIKVKSLRSEYKKLSNQNMIIYKPETYYCFTEKDQYRDFMFDNEATSVNLPKGTGASAKTYIEEIWMAVTKPSKSTDYDKGGLNDFTTIFDSLDTSSSCTCWYQSNMSPVYDNRSGTNYKVSIGTWVNPQLTDYGMTNGRQPYTVQGFPWYSINNWNQLYCVNNDWVTKDSKSLTASSMIKTPAGDKHLSLMGGWPIIEVEKDHRYKYVISFKEAGDHVVFGKLTPFETDDTTTESNLIEWDDTITKTTWDSKNVAFCKDGETITLSFKALESGILYLKWADDEPTSHNLTGGGTIKLSTEIIDIIES